MAQPLQLDYHYIRLTVSPPCSDALTIRRAMQDAMAQSCGIYSTTYADVLWIAEDGTETVVRLNKEDAAKILAAIAVATSPRMSLVKESPFLPSLLSRPL